MKTTIKAAVAAATIAMSLTAVAPVLAQSQHCFTYQKRVCKPSHSGAVVCQTTTERRCVRNNNDMRKQETPKDSFQRKNRKKCCSK